MRAAEREKAIELRVKEQLGYGTIAKQLGVPKSTLSYWLRDMPLSPKRILELRREAWGRGEASRELFRQTMREKRLRREEIQYKRQLRKFRVISDQSLFVAGLMLYLAEGDKKDYYHIGFANTDPRIIRFFVWWLGRFLQIKKRDIRVQLHLYESMNIPAERRFWRKQTEVPPKQFYKDQIRRLRPNSFSYSGSFRHGTCKIYVNGFQKTSELMLSIRAFLDRYDRF